ncbi:hypothetical protein B0H11DRAFT_2216927 [Mycena galericulata]|nr:hypothetical protein B0H11DRAFT_2216927 [Mycena galericulata]
MPPGLIGKTTLSSIPALLFILRVSAVPTNHTVDDASPLIRYIPTNLKTCIGCVPPGEFDTSHLLNGTVTIFEDDVVTPGIPHGLELNFTGMSSSLPRTAIYLFLAQPSTAILADVGMGCDFYIDGQRVGPSYESAPQNVTQYDMLAYANTSLADGPHTFVCDTTFFRTNFDFLIYTSNDPDPSSSASPSGSSTPTGISSTPSEARSSSPPSPSPGGAAVTTPKTKDSVRAIAGAALGVAALLFLLTALYLYRRRRKSISKSNPSSSSDATGDTMPMLVKHPVDAFPAVRRSYLSSSSSPSYADSARASESGVVDEIRSLRAQVSRLEERVAVTGEGDSVGMERSSAAVPVRRSVSSMKRDQTRALLEDQDFYEGRDSLVDTDSGIRLFAGRTRAVGVVDVEELPPTYMAE